MTIYTKTGDDGLTAGPRNERIRKCDPRVEALGAVDELNANVGWSLAAAGDGRHRGIRKILQSVQPELSAINAILGAVVIGQKPNVTLDEPPVRRMEQQIDAAWEKLPKLTSFIIPGGCELASRLQVTRTVCRRTERALVRAAETDAPLPTLVFQYINRLSDLLFALGRVANDNEGVAERLWKPRGESQ